MATSTERESDLPHFVAHLGRDGGLWQARRCDATRVWCDGAEYGERETEAVGAITQVIRVPWDSIVASRR
jgi:hypothetical protein